MENKEAEILLLKLREAIDRLRSEPDITYSKLQEIADEVGKIAEKLSPTGSVDESAARVSILSEEQLKQLQEPLRKIRVVHHVDNVTSIMNAPRVSQQEYYKKALWQIDETIAAMLYSLREEQ